MMVMRYDIVTFYNQKACEIIDCEMNNLKKKQVAHKNIDEAWELFIMSFKMCWVRRNRNQSPSSINYVKKQ